MIFFDEQTSRKKNEDAFWGCHFLLNLGLMLFRVIELDDSLEILKNAEGFEISTVRGISKFVVDAKELSILIMIWNIFITLLIAQ
jgi:hypothetical protein